MIKNIVFDMGKVLVDYEPMPVCRQYIEKEEDQTKVCEAIFQSPEWRQLDMGVITDEEALKNICGRLPERLHEAAVLCMRDWHKYNMQTMHEMEPLVRELKERGFGIYLCSNAAIRLKDMYREVLPAANCFDGVLFSAEVKCVKPQKEMYEHFFRRFDLKPEECFFIDDLPQNIVGALACGMDGFCFEKRDLEELKTVLKGVTGV